jgi:hypothetical protein
LNIFYFKLYLILFISFQIHNCSRKHFHLELLPRGLESAEKSSEPCQLQFEMQQICHWRKHFYGLRLVLWNLHAVQCKCITPLHCTIWDRQCKKMKNEKTGETSKTKCWSVWTLDCGLNWINILQFSASRIANIFFSHIWDLCILYPIPISNTYNFTEEDNLLSSKYDFGSRKKYFCEDAIKIN